MKLTRSSLKELIRQSIDELKEGGKGSGPQKGGGHLINEGGSFNIEPNVDKIDPNSTPKKSYAFKYDNYFGVAGTVSRMNNTLDDLMKELNQKGLKKESSVILKSYKKDFGKFIDTLNKTLTDAGPKIK